jgi:hypothetical protein
MDRVSGYSIAEMQRSLEGVRNLDDLQKNNFERPRKPYRRKFKRPLRLRSSSFRQFVAQRIPTFDHASIILHDLKRDRFQTQNK